MIIKYCEYFWAGWPSKIKLIGVELVGRGHIKGASEGSDIMNGNKEQGSKHNELGRGINF